MRPVCRHVIVALLVLVACYIAAGLPAVCLLFKPSVIGDALALKPITYHCANRADRAVPEAELLASRFYVLVLAAISAAAGIATFWKDGDDGRYVFILHSRITMKSRASFDAHQLASMGFGPTRSSLADEPASEHWIRFSLKDAGSCEGLRCHAHFADGSVEEGSFDSDNKVHFDRPNASVCQKVDVVLAAGQTGGQSVMGNILMAMVG